MGPILSAHGIPVPIAREHARVYRIPTMVERRIAADKAMHRRENIKTALWMAALVAVFVAADLTGPDPWLKAIWHGVVQVAREVLR